MFVKNLAGMIVTGLAVVGASVVTYRTYKIKKAAKQNVEQTVIDISVERSDEDSRN